MKKVRLRTIGSKMTVLFVLCALLLSAALSVFSYYSSWQQYTEFFSHKAEEMVAIIAANADGDKITSYLKTGKTDAYYEELSRVLVSIKREADINYLYLFSPGDDHFTYILEAAMDTDDMNYINHMGDVYKYTSLEYTYLVPDVQAKRASTEKIISSDAGYGPSVSAWAPILTSSGELAAMVEADYSLVTVTDMLKANVLNSLLMSLGLIATMIVVLALLSRRIVSRPLALLTQNVLNFVSGNTLGEFPHTLRTGDEMQTLSEAFGQMATDIEHYTRHITSVAADKERIATELSLAMDIQMSLLPRAYPAFPGRDEFGVYAQLQPAKVVGGDFYDYFLIDSNRLCIAAGGVSGQGIPAALFMVVAKTVIKNQMMTGKPVEEAMAVINTRLFESTSAKVAVTAFVGVLEIASGRLSYVNAGCSAPLLMRKEGSYEFVAGQTMTPLAEVESVSYRAIETQLRQGDRLVLYSGGVPDARNPQGQAFGGERLRAALNRSRGKNMDLKTLTQLVCDEVTVFTEDVEQAKDVTVLSLEYSKGDRARAEISVRAREDGFAAAQRFLKRQLAENGLGGPLYATLSVAAEEAFMLASAQVSGRGEITVRCAVEENGAKTVTVSLLYSGKQSNPLEAEGAAGDAVAFMRRSMDEVHYAYQDGSNSIILKKRA